MEENTPTVAGDKRKLNLRTVAILLATLAVFILIFAATMAVFNKSPQENIEPEASRVLTDTEKLNLLNSLPESSSESLSAEEKKKLLGNSNIPADEGLSVDEKAKILESL